MGGGPREHSYHDANKCAIVLLVKTAQIALMFGCEEVRIRLRAYRLPPFRRAAAAIPAECSPMTSGAGVLQVPAVDSDIGVTSMA